MSDDLPRAIATSTLKIGAMELVCHVLNNGQRVFEAPGFEALVQAMLGEGDTVFTDDEMEAVARMIHGKLDA